MIGAVVLTGACGVGGASAVVCQPFPTASIRRRWGARSLRPREGGPDVHVGDPARFAFFARGGLRGEGNFECHGIETPLLDRRDLLVGAAVRQVFGGPGTGGCIGAAVCGGGETQRRRPRSRQALPRTPCRCVPNRSSLRYGRFATALRLLSRLALLLYAGDPNPPERALNRRTSLPSPVTPALRPRSSYFHSIVPLSSSPDDAPV